MTVIYHTPLSPDQQRAAGMPTPQPLAMADQVRFSDLDTNNHVNNTVYIRWMEAARFEYFEKVELRSATAQSGRTGILKSVDCNFRLPLTWPDKVLVGGKVIELGKDYFVIQHVVFSRNHQKVAAHGRAVVVGFDYRKQKKSDFPPGLVEKIQKLEDMT